MRLPFDLYHNDKSAAPGWSLNGGLGHSFVRKMTPGKNTSILLVVEADNPGLVSYKRSIGYLVF